MSGSSTLAYLKSILPPPSDVLKSSKILIDKKLFTIGRSLQTNHNIPFPSISRSHCTIEQNEEGMWSIKDTSSFGIQINNEKIEKDRDHVICHGDIIQLDLAGDFKYKFVCNKKVSSKRKLDSGKEEPCPSKKSHNGENLPSTTVNNSDEENTTKRLQENLKFEYEKKLKEIAEEKDKKLDELKKELEVNLKSQFQKELEEFKHKIEEAAKPETSMSPPVTVEKVKEKSKKIEVTLDSQVNFAVRDLNDSNASSSLGNLLESELQCPICSELFIEATSLGCSHTFCSYCIKTWRNNNRQCPVCRKNITTQCPNLIVNSIIQGLVDKMDQRSKGIREECIKQRAKEAKSKKPSLPVSVPVIDLTSLDYQNYNLPRRSSRRGRRSRRRQ